MNIFCILLYIMHCALFIYTTKVIVYKKIAARMGGDW